MRSEKRGNLYLLTGIILGFIIGLAYAWVLAPVEYVNTTPDTLQEQFKQAYILQIAHAYQANGDAARAQARIALFREPNIGGYITGLAQQFLAKGSPVKEVRALSSLAEVALLSPGELPALPTNVPLPTGMPTATYTPSPTNTIAPTSTNTQKPAEPTAAGAEKTPQKSATPTLSPTPLPTRTPSPTPAEPFVLAERNLVCDPKRDPAILMVNLRDAAGNGIPGVEIIVNWPSGEEHFFTGLKPDIDAGFADFEMIPGITYTLRLADGSQRLTDLKLAECTAQNGDRIWGSWELIFEQPR